jgi:hypothetical protein
MALPVGLGGASSRIAPRGALPRFLEIVLLAAAVCAVGCGSRGLPVSPVQPSNEVGGNPIQVENARVGTADWELSNPAIDHEIEGYASRTSVNRGGSISFLVNTAEPTYDLEVFRLGWYDGLGGRRMTEAVALPGTSQPIPSPDPVTGLVECQWTDPYILPIPTDPDDPSNWASGVYLAKLTAGTTGKQSYIIFVVRDDERPSDFLFQSSVNTFQAYNNWGDKSLYDFNSLGEGARKVSFNRPYGVGPQSPSYVGVGAGEFLANVQPESASLATAWEYPFLRFMEREGYDVTYSTDIDTHVDGDALLDYKALLSVGHNEYWTWEQRDHVTAARDAGVSLGFFSANSIYWQVRFEPGFDGTPNRTVVCYKERSFTEDPNYLSGLPELMHLVTVRWREDPVNLPEDALIGVMYIKDPVQSDIVVDDDTNWVYADTGLSNGDRLVGLLGYEVDQMFGNAPPGTVRIAHSVFGTGERDFSDATVYTASSGATVFAIGSMQWSWGLDDYGVPTMRPSALNPAAQQVTRNVLARFAGAN